MASCECCWADRTPFVDVASREYQTVLKMHEDRGCVCTKNTVEGQKARAGQFWDEKEMRDKRYTPEEWAPLLKDMNEEKTKMPSPTHEEMDQKAMELLKRLVLAMERLTSKVGALEPAVGHQTKLLSGDLNRIAFALEGIMSRLDSR